MDHPGILLFTIAMHTFVFGIYFIKFVTVTPLGKR